MATDFQLFANRANAQRSTGPQSDEGKIKASRNAVKLGLFTTNNCILPGEEDEYARFRDELWAELRPASPLQQVHAAEVVRAAWRLRRCALAEERLGWRAEWHQEDYNREHGSEMIAPDPSICSATMKEQASVDRARAQAQNSLRRAQAALEKLQNEAKSSQHAAVSQPDLTSCEATAEPIAAPELQNEANVAVHTTSEEKQNEANSTPANASSCELQNEANSGNPRVVLTRAA